MSICLNKVLLRNHILQTQRSTSVSPFSLVYSIVVRGPTAASISFLVLPTLAFKSPITMTMLCFGVSSIIFCNSKDKAFFFCCLIRWPGEAVAIYVEAKLLATRCFEGKNSNLKRMWEDHKVLLKSRCEMNL